MYSVRYDLRKSTDGEANTKIFGIGFYFPLPAFIVDYMGDFSSNEIIAAFIADTEAR